MRQAVSLSFRVALYAAKMAESKSPLIDKNKGLIIYAGVVRQPKRTNLAEYTGFAGNFKSMIPDLLKNVNSSAQRSSSKLSDGKHALHHFTNLALSISFVCLAEVGMGKELPFKFLVQLEEQFAQTYSLDSVLATREGGMQEAFEDKIKQLVESYNAPPASESRTKKMLDKVEAVNENLQEAMAHVLEREDRINDLADRTERIAASSLTLQTEATALHRRVWWKNTRIIIIVVAVAVLLVLLILWDLFS